MLFKSRFYYDAAAENNGGGGAAEEVKNDKPASDGGTVQEEVKGGAAEVKNEDKGAVVAELPEEVKVQLARLKELEEENKTLKSNVKPAEKTKEELEKEAEMEKVNLRKFAVEHNLAKDDDFVKFETLSTKEKKDLVFENFRTQYIADNKEDFSDESELEEAAKEAFDEQYHIGSKNKTLQATGQRLLEKEAKDLLNPYESKINSAKEKFEGFKQEQQSEVELKKFHDEKYVPFRESLKTAIPSKITVGTLKDGDKEVPVELDVTVEEREEAEKKFLLNHKTFFKFQEAAKEGKIEGVQKEMLDKINNYLLLKKHAEGMEKFGQLREEMGTKKGSDIGAKNPFPINENNKVIQMNSGETVEDGAKKVAASMRKYANR